MIPSRPQLERRSRRRAFTLVEVATTVLLLGVVFGTVGSVLVAANRRGRLAEQRRMALQAASNLLEDLTALPWDDLPEASPALPTDVRSALPDAALDVRIEPMTEADVRRLVVEIRWRDASGQEVAPARLVTWVHRDGGLRR